MENKKSVLAGSLIASAFIGLSNISVSAATLTNYSALGSGSEVRSTLLNGTSSSLKALELKCGDSAKTHHSKGKDGKCGDAKCGDKKGKGKDGKCGEGKAKDAKCGEGKCGDKKKETK